MGKKITGGAFVLLLIAFGVVMAFGGSDTQAAVSCDNVHGAIQDNRTTYRATDNSEEKEKLNEELNQLRTKRMECREAAKAPSTTEAPAEEEAEEETESVDPESGLPLVSGGPLLVGDQDSQEPVVGHVRSWTEAVDRMREEEPWYATCTDKRIGVTLEDAEEYAALEANYDLRFILIVNSTVSDDEARQQLEAEGFENVDELVVKRIDQIRNTRRTHVGGENRCQAFWDQRPQVRISLAIPVMDEKEPDLVVGLLDDRGLLGHCGNPWDLPPETPPPPVEPPTTEPPCECPTTTEGRKSAVPTTVAPPPVTAPPTTGTTVQPPPPPPSTAAPDPTPPNVTVVNPTPPPNTYTPPGAVVGTTQPPATVAPPATNPAAEPGNGGTSPTPSR